jgi:hypothetical protein
MTGFLWVLRPSIPSCFLFKERKIPYYNLYGLHKHKLLPIDEIVYIEEPKLLRCCFGPITT